MDIKEFYVEKQRAGARLTRELLAGKHPGQPALETYVDPDDDAEKHEVTWAENQIHTHDVRYVRALGLTKR